VIYTEIILAALSVTSVIFGKWQAGKLSKLTAEVEALKSRTVKLESEVAHRDGIIRDLRSRIDGYQLRVEDLLREIAKGGQYGVF